MNINSLVDYQVNDQPNIMEVRTEKIPPIQSSAYRHTFRLPTTGWLDKNTLLLFKGVAKDASTSDENCRFNIFSGALGAIKRVQFQVGDYSIQDLSEANLWATVNKLHTESPDKQNDYWAHYLHNSIRYKVLETTDRGTFGNGGVMGAIVVDNDASGINWGTAAGDGAVINNCKITNNADNNFLNAVPFGLIMPSLSGVNLPLFLFSDYRVQLIVEFEKDSSKYANKLGNLVADNFACDSGDIVFEKVEILIDQLIYPSAVQDTYLQRTNEAGGYELDFLNVVNVKKTIPVATANVRQSEEMSINVANQEVHYVQMLKKFANNLDDGNDKVLLGQRSQSISIESVQWNINGTDTYPNPYFSPLSHYNQLSYVLGVDIQVPKALCVADVNTQYGMASPVESAIAGKYKVMGLTLANGNPVIRGGGTNIGNYPIRCRYTRTPHGEVKQTVDATADTKIALTELDSLNVDFFVAMSRVVKIQRTSRGMSVIVVN
tara:strand:+ start:5001 stop:6473 length:1473 start_codon:yes stop_codon:yes gene_type:complete